MKNFLSNLFVLIFLVACQKNKKIDGKNLIYPLSNEIETIDPANSYDTVSAQIVYQIYETLYEYDYLKRPYVLKPLLADGMPDISDNGLKYKIKIKKNIKYHDNTVIPTTRTVKAEDFLTQIKRIAFQKTGSPGWWLFDGKIKGINEFRQKAGTDLEKFYSLDISGIKILDDYTFTIELIKPNPQFEFALAMSFTAPMPIEVVKFHKNVLIDNEYGTGPFKLKIWNKGLEVILDKFKDYRDDFYPKIGDRFANENQLLLYAGQKIPFLDSINFQIMKESQTRWLNFMSKKIDLIVLDKDNFKTAIESNGGLSKELEAEKVQLQTSPTLTYWWLAFNMKDPVVGKNLNLRKAIAHAINVEEYILYFTNNTAQKANSIFPPGIQGYSPTHQLPYEYNLEKAKTYLKAAGFPNGKGLPTLTYDVRGNSTTNRQMGEFIQKELQKIGIKIEINMNTFPAFLNKLKNGDLQFWLGGWALDFPDGENILQLLHSNNFPPGSNSSFYSNESVDKLIDQATVLKDGIEKIDLMEKVQDQVNKDLPWVMLYYSRNNILLQKSVKNYRYSDIINNHFKYLDMVVD